MPIYEYLTASPSLACEACRRPFEVIQKVNDPLLSDCPACGGPVTKIMSWCRAAVVETSTEDGRVMNQVSQYEREGLHSHAAELADKHAAKSGDQGLKSRALDNYRKAGYDDKTLSKHDNDTA